MTEMIETVSDPPPLWWTRIGMLAAPLHQHDPAHPGQSRCGLVLAGRFRPATSAEVKRRRKCDACCPKDRR